MTQTALVTRRSVTSRDEYNDDVVADVAPFTVPCYLSQTARTEDASGNIEDQTFVAFLPAGTAVGPADQLTVNGAAFEIVGPPAHAYNPRARTVSHIEATVRQVQ